MARQNRAPQRPSTSSSLPERWRTKRIAVMAVAGLVLSGAAFAADTQRNHGRVTNDILARSGAPFHWEGNEDSQPSHRAERSKDSTPVVFLDPGHSRAVIDRNDKKTGLHDGDYPTFPEIEEVWSVTKLVEAELVRDGYKVVLSKESNNANVFLRDRATAADTAGAAIAVSIHDDHGADNTWGAIFDQRVGQYRGTAPNIVRFTDSAVAAKSQRFSAIIAKSRSEAQGINVVVKENSFNGRRPIEPGNIPLVELFSKTPWVYCETGAKQGLSEPQQQAYAAGIAAGIEQAVPITEKASVPNIYQN